MGACTSKPILNISNEYIPTNTSGAQKSLKEVENIILKAAKERGWSPRVVEPGLIEASISVRSHRATIEIPYSEAKYSINYKDSVNLNATSTKIHRNYNNWIVRLSRTIQQQLGVSTQNY